MRSIWVVFAGATVASLVCAAAAQESELQRAAGKVGAVAAGVVGQVLKQHAEYIRTSSILSACAKDGLFHALHTKYDIRRLVLDAVTEDLLKGLPPDAKWQVEDTALNMLAAFQAGFHAGIVAGENPTKLCNGAIESADKLLKQR